MRRTAAEMAAAAVYELYPDVELRGGGETSTGFHYDFFTPHPIQIQVIEERLRQIVREKRPIRTLEMVPFSAAELLKKEGHLERLAELQEQADGLVQLMEMGLFYDLSPGPHLKNSAELAAFKISLEPLDDKGFRIVGWCHTSKDLLKRFLKQLAQYRDPVQIGEEGGLWKGPIWLPRGLQLRQRLLDFLKKEWFDSAYEIAGSQEVGRTEVHRSLGRPKVAEIDSATRIQVSFFHKIEAEWISSLQLIAKTLTILGFDHSTLSKGQETGYWIEDGIGRGHPVVQVKRLPQKRAGAFDFIFTADVQKIFHLLLEKNLMVNVENQ